MTGAASSVGASRAGATTGAERIYAGYFALQAVAGVLLWIGIATSSTVRSGFELVTARPEVTDAFLGPDMVVVAGSALSAWAIVTHRSWAVLAAGFTAGGIVYPTVYLFGWARATEGGDRHGRARGDDRRVVAHLLVCLPGLEVASMSGGDDGVAIAVEPAGTSHWLERRGGDVWLADAVAAGGGRVVGPGEATGMVWCETSEPDALRAVLDAHPAIEWVQLPFAGIEPYVGVLDDRHVWTCAKRAYAAAVAEHALALTLAGLRGLWPYARATSWVVDHGRNLYGAHVVVLGGGGIAEALLGLLEPFGCTTTCVRRHPTPVPGADRTVTDDALAEVLGGADVVVLAVPLTPATTGIIDAAALHRMPEHAWLVNVGRGRLVVTDDLVTALREGWIAGAALDVTDPEPLPDDHPLWSMDNCLVTPHVANTHAMLRPRLVELVTENVRRFAAGEPLLGLIDVAAGY